MTCRCGFDIMPGGARVISPRGLCPACRPMTEAAEPYAWGKWPDERLYTYVDPRRIKSRNPGYCFKQAGWRECGYTKGGLLILEKLPGWEARVD